MSSGRHNPWSYFVFCTMMQAACLQVDCIRQEFLKLWKYVFVVKRIAQQPTKFEDMGPNLYTTLRKWPYIYPTHGSDPHGRLVGISLYEISFFLFTILLKFVQLSTILTLNIMVC